MKTNSQVILAIILVCMAAALGRAADGPRTIEPLVRVVDLNLGESAEVTLCDGSQVTVKLVDLKEIRDVVSHAVRQAEVTVEVNGQQVKLVSATYHLPQMIGELQIDCSITKGYNENGSPSFWGLDKDARLRLWPAGSPLVRSDTFSYPAKQKWFATDTHMANDPVYVASKSARSIQAPAKRSGTSVTAAPRSKSNLTATPSSSLPTATTSRPGRVISQGDRIGLLGKEGGSGGWSHLHFEIKSTTSPPMP